MTIQLDPELVDRLSEVARNQGRSVEAVALETLRSWVGAQTVSRIEPRDEWERRLLDVGIDCGVSLSDEDLGRERIYED